MDRVTKKFWKDILAQEIFTPLGMKNTSAYVSKFKREDLATPYGITLAGWTARPYGKTDANMQSAGGLITTLRDMGTWLEANINDGRINGRQVLSASAFETAQRIIDQWLLIHAARSRSDMGLAGKLSYLETTP
jgi:CubicO group peptidase (beta-lactamase class C family)